MTSTFPYGSGGEFFAPELRQLQALGHEVVVCPVRPRGPLSTGEFDVVTLAPWGVRSLRAAGAAPIWSMRLLPLLLSRSGRWTVTAKNLSVLPAAVSLAHLARDRRIDHIHAAWASVPATVAMGAALLYPVPWSMTAHRWDIGENNLLVAKLRTAMKVRFIAKDGLDMARSITGLSPHENWFVSHLGVEVPGSSPQTVRTRSVVCVVGALSARKRPLDVVRAVSSLQPDRRPRVTFFGDGELRPELERAVSQFGLDAEIELMGHRRHGDLLQWLDGGGADIIVLASESEGIPVSLMEAMARGIPAVATRAGGIPELVDDSCGRLVDVGDLAALASAIEALTSDDKLRSKLGVAARQRVSEKFNVRTTARHLVQHIESAPSGTSTSG